MRVRFVVIALATAAVFALSAQAAAAAPAWAPASSATIHPGVQTFTDGAQCTANFVFFDATNVYLGQAAHCSGTGSSTDTDGCTSAWIRSSPARMRSRASSIVSARPP